MTRGDATDPVAEDPLPPWSAARIRSLRGPRVEVDPRRPIAVWDEWDVAAADVAVATRVVLLAGAECRFTCGMCDLWRHTLEQPTEPGSLPAQISAAVAADGGLGLESGLGPRPRWIKLYNGSNFFDPRSVPPNDVPAIAAALTDWDRVIVENHPRLGGPAVTAFRDLVAGRLEVAMGLETVHPRILPWLGKQMTAADFSAACEWLRSENVAVRAFVLLGLPTLDAREAEYWCLESVAFATRAGASHVSIIPTRSGDGLFDDLSRKGLFRPPTAASLERALETALARDRGGAIVTADPWNWTTLTGHCDTCRDARLRRLSAMNLAQRPLPPHRAICPCFDEHAHDV
ncbi:MAG: radical SAM protein [Planctomycetia bacterium]